MRLSSRTDGPGTEQNARFAFSFNLRELAGGINGNGQRTAIPYAGRTGKADSVVQDNDRSARWPMATEGGNAEGLRHGWSDLNPVMTGLGKLERPLCLASTGELTLGSQPAYGSEDDGVRTRNLRRDRPVL